MEMELEVSLNYVTSGSYELVQYNKYPSMFVLYTMLYVVKVISKNKGNFLAKPYESVT